MVSFCLLFTEILYPKSKFKGTGENLDISVNRDTCDKGNNEGCFIFYYSIKRLFPIQSLSSDFDPKWRYT